MRRRNIPHRKISIHALCEEGDSFSFSNRPVFSSFLSTPSARRATQMSNTAYQRAVISIHALCEEGDINVGKPPFVLTLFLSTPSARRATVGHSGLVYLVKNFYPRPLRGGRPSRRRWCPRRDTHFYPRPLRGGRLHGEDGRAGRKGHFYPRPLRGGRHHFQPTTLRLLAISIHALCEEGDTRMPTVSWDCSYFYPRPLRGGRRFDS